MEAVTSSTLDNASAGSVQGAAALLMLKKSNAVEEGPALQLIHALPQATALATTGPVGTQVNTFA